MSRIQMQVYIMYRYVGVFREQGDVSKYDVYVCVKDPGLYP